MNNNNGCGRCFYSRDKDGNPTAYCTGLCNVIVISITEKMREVIKRGQAMVRFPQVAGVWF